MFGEESDDDTFDSVAPKKKLHKLGKRRRANQTSDEDDVDVVDDSGYSPVTPNISISAANSSHPAFNGSDAAAHSTPELHLISPDELKEAKQKKRSFIGDQLAQVSSLVNDDQEESRQLAQESHVSVSISDSMKNDSRQQKNDSKLQLGYDIAGLCLGGNLSSEQLSEQLANCIQLNAANKINKGNAFNLQLIDYMFVLLKRNDKAMQDFPTMSCSLDASTRIYACRVDSVHAGIMEIVTGLSRATDKNKKKMSKDGDDSDGELSDGEAANKQQTKARKRKARIASSLDALCRTSIETASWMQRPAIQPDFSSLLSYASITQSENCRLSLLQDHIPFVPLRRNRQIADSSNRIVSVPIPIVLPTVKYDYDFGFSWSDGSDDDDDDANDHDCTMDSNFSFNVHNNTVISAVSHRNSTCASGERVVDDALPKSVVVENSVFVDDVINNDDQMVIDESCGDDDRHDDSGDDSSKTVEIVGEVENKKRRNDTLSFVSGKALLADGDSCFSYIDSDLLPDMWMGPDYWKPKFKRGKPAACQLAPEKATEKKTKRKTKRTDLISFEDFSKVDAVFNKKLESSIPTRKNTKWSASKLCLPDRKNCKMEDIYRSFLRKSLFYKPFLKPEKDSTEARIEFEYADDGEHLFNDTNKMAHIDDDICVVNNQSDCDDYGDAMSPEPAAAVDEEDDDHDADAGSNVFSAENLVPLPKLVQCDTIKYATVPKRLDMKKLKNTIWRLMDLENDKENRRSQKSSAGAIKKDDDLTFSNIYKRLPEHLSGEMSKDMSPALAFLATLHLANEKSLSIKSADTTLTDFVIKKDYFDGS